MSGQIYKEILNFKLREPNPYGLKVQFQFRYRNNESIGITRSGVKPPTLFIYNYIIDNIARYNLIDRDKIDEVITRSCTISLHPDKVGIRKQHLPTYIQELVDLNFIVKAPGRGYDYYVNPYYCNTLSREMTMHVVAQVAELLQSLPAQTSLFE